MKCFVCLGFYSCYIKNLHVDSQPFYDMIKDWTPFHWTHEHGKLFQSVKNRIIEDTILAVPSCDYRFQILVDSSKMSELAVFQSNSFLGENESSPSTRGFLIKLNRKCLHSIENYVENFQLYTPTSTTSLDLLFL